MKFGVKQEIKDFIVSYESELSSLLASEDPSWSNQRSFCDERIDYLRNNIGKCYEVVALLDRLEELRKNG